MKWEGNRESDNVEDRRGESGGGGGGGLPFGGIHLGLGGIVLVLLGSWVFHVNPLTVLNLLSGGDNGSAQTSQVAPDQPAHAPPATDQKANFVRTVLASTEDVWSAVFQQQGKTYQPPKLVLYSREYPTGCGDGQSAMGPFYCPQDHKVYIDLDFYQMLRDQLGSPGEAAQAYVVAHEVGHHVQNLLGIMSQVEKARQQGQPQEGATGLSVRTELQADCFAGVWGNKSQAQLDWLHEGDVEAALNAAAQVGDDTLQKQARGYVVPDSFTHGTAAQRAKWFKAGFASGDIKSCNTFDAAAL